MTTIVGILEWFYHQLACQIQHLRVWKQGKSIFFSILVFMSNWNFFVFCCFMSQVNSYGHCRTVSSPNYTFSWASLNKQLTRIRAHTFACNWQQPFLHDSAEGRRMTVEIISWSISTKVWDRVGIKLATPGSAVRLTSVARHITDCAMWHSAIEISCSVEVSLKKGLSHRALVNKELSEFHQTTA